jgi:hypothetical protein
MVPSKITYPDGTIMWFYKYGTGRAVLHRADGPALINSNGTQEWCLAGQHVKKEDIPLFTGKEEDLVVLKLKYGF